MTIEEIAEICHTANKKYCEQLSDYSQPDWHVAPDWQRRSAINGVRFRLQNLDEPVSANHESWLEEKTKDGWKYGPVKDAEKKEHPCMMPFHELPAQQVVKDHLFTAIVKGLSGFVRAEVKRAGA